ncbi:proteoglycan 4 [Rhipicephalus sanguineus]|uniref:proteoglycan 4 n=1 Tax=Rhipicephalus sanguineus TaxID=34632 RepID=UPI001892FC14|nr:proteoglycan 4 [Rhipicephalus sanguineus]
MPQKKTTRVLQRGKRNVPGAGDSGLQGEHVASGSTSGHKRKRLSSGGSSSAVSESSGSSAQKKPKLSKGVGNSGGEAKCSDVPAHQGTRTHSAPQGRSKGPTTVQRSEPLGDRSPRYYFRSIRPTANKPQEARSCKPESNTTSTHLQEKRNVPAAANSEQRLEQMANSSRCAGKRKRVPSPSSTSASVCSRNEKRPKPPPSTSRDPRTTTGPKESPKPLSRAEKRALAEQAVCRANYKRFMKEVYPELVKAKSPWAWSGISTTPDGPKSSQRSHTPGKRPLSETAEARLGRPSARPEGAPVGKRSYWYVPKALKDYKPDEKPRETRRYKYRTPDPSSVDDSPIGTVKQPTYNFWQNSGRSWKRSTRPGPELLMESDGVEAAVNSLKAAAAKGSETSSPKAQSPRVCKLLERRGEEPPMPPKGHLSPQVPVRAPGPVTVLLKSCSGELIPVKGTLAVSVRLGSQKCDDLLHVV